MSEKRRYIRISTVVPVEFYIQGIDGKQLTPWLQGFSCDISRGGICLQVNDLWWGFADRINSLCRLFLKINLPLKQSSFNFQAKIIWIKQEKVNEFNRFFIGLEFVEASPNYAIKLLRFALTKRFGPIIIAAITAALASAALIAFWHSYRLIEENRRIVNNHVQILEKRANLEKFLQEERINGELLHLRQNNLQEKIFKLQTELKQSQERHQSIVDEQSREQQTLKEHFHQSQTEFIKTQAEFQNIKQEKQQLENTIAAVNKQLEMFKRENEFLKIKEQQIKQDSVQLKTQAVVLDKETRRALGQITQGMYEWIKNRQDLIQGLVLSYEGDRQLSKLSFTYDQALAIIVFLLNNDNDRAKKILDFYLTRIQKKQDIFNAYYTTGHSAENIVHCGPNAWIGLAALQYVEKTGDKKYLAIAQKSADTLLTMMDAEGGIKGGPTVSWYATEHNLDASAFFDFYYRLTGQKKYQQAGQKIRQWIRSYAYTSSGVPIKRGKGDSTIATDTYAWSITAIGPRILLEMDMNPESILDFAVENCAVKTTFKRKNSEILICGFDFAKGRNLSRGGVVSGEWTAQMILAFEIMADYFKISNPQKYRQYFDNAEFYCAELQKMLITSLSKAGREDPCLPYASQPLADTGHGWRTPDGNHTGSLSSTAYFLIAYYGYNPLTGKYLEVSLKDELK